MTIWNNVEKPSPLGALRAEAFPQYDKRFGAGNWRLAWSVRSAMRSHDVDFLGACALYEDAYHAYLSKHPAVVAALTKEAGDVCAFHIGDVASGLDYTVQKSPALHVHDIAIRRVLTRLGTTFQGSGCVQVGLTVSLPLGRMLAPGKLPFHRPDWLEPLTGHKVERVTGRHPISGSPGGMSIERLVPPWDKPYDLDSIEDFFVRNCWLQQAQDTHEKGR